MILIPLTSNSMKVLKYIAQIVAAVAYSLVIEGLFGWLLSLLFKWMISLSIFWMITLLFFGGTIFSLLVYGLGSFAAYPFTWTNKKNIVATILSVLMMVVLFGNWVISMFGFPHGGGFVPVVTLIIFTCIFLYLGFTIVGGAIVSYRGVE